VYILKEIKNNKTTSGFFDLVEDFEDFIENLLAITIITYKNYCKYKKYTIEYGYINSNSNL
tara:strand:+ start:2143 stop:2325 length:183 start_codon:yes stop_codon:yes gene_type:complete